MHQQYLLHKYTNLTAGDKVLANSVLMVRHTEAKQTEQLMTDIHIQNLVYILMLENYTVVYLD